MENGLGTCGSHPLSTPQDAPLQLEGGLNLPTLSFSEIRNKK